MCKAYASAIHFICMTEVLLAEGSVDLTWESEVLECAGLGVDQCMYNAEDGSQDSNMFGRP